jgi:hypothetical protein
MEKSKPHPAGYWTYERCKEVALKCDNKTELRSNYSGVYIPATRNGWWDEITSHMVKKPLVSIYDSKDIVEEIKKYSSRSDLINNGAGLYDYIQRKNLLHIYDEIYPSKIKENKELLLENKKKCNKCNEILDIINFDLQSVKSSNKKYRGNCKKCFSLNSKEYWSKVREGKLKEDGLVSKKKLWAQGKKKCCLCNEVKELNNFYYRESVDKYAPKCNECMVHYRRKIKGVTEETLIREELHRQHKKKCPSCNEIKSYDDFGRNKNSFNGIAASCKICKSVRDKEYREDPKHRDKNLRRKKNYYENTKHTERHLENQKRSREKRDYKEEYQRLISDEFRKFKQNIRQLTNVHFKKRKDWVRKDTKTIELLGTDYFVAKDFISRQFLKGMTWENHGKVWHIDHVIPLDASNKDPEILKRLCYYENLSPMWSTENLSKGYKIPYICTLWENPVVPYKVDNLVIVPKYNGTVGRYKLKIDIGTRYGMLTVISDEEISTEKNARLVKVKCDCGTIKDIALNPLRLGVTKSCGCLHKIKTSEHNSKYKKLLFTNEELKIIKEYVKTYPKGVKVPNEFINRFPGKTLKQLNYIIREVRNNKLKRLNHI